MIETVRQRQQNANDFKACYENLCALQGSCPLGSVVGNLGEDTLDCNADRVMPQDWKPILDATRINRNLKVIAFRSYWQERLCAAQTEFPTSSKLYRKKIPAIRSKDVTHNVCRALKDCLCVTENLDVLILQDIPLREKDLTCLSKGISKNKTLNHLSFENCQIGDGGFEAVCSAIRNCPTLVSLNLTGCCLTWRGAEMLAKLIKYQATKKHSVAWQDSLRYRVPDLDRMSGMRRVTLCKNSLLGDRGAELLAEPLKDDLWLKALDLQQCGISNRGALAFQSLLRCNKSLVVLDLRINPLIDRDLVCSITQHVLVNAGRIETEYPWLATHAPLPGRHNKSKKTKNQRRARSGVTKVGVSKVKKSPSVVRQGYSATKVSMTNVGPWRTAARVGPNRHRNIKRAWPYTETQETVTSVKELNVAVEESEEETSSCSDQPSQDVHNRKIGELELEVEYLKHCVGEECRSRTAESEKVLELQLENRRLRQEISLLKAAGLTSRDIISSTLPEEQEKRHVSKQDFLDDNVLESIERSFKQFHAFLDMLNGAELQDLQKLLDQMRQEKGDSQCVGASGT